MAGLKFDIKLKELSVDLVGSDGVERHYVIRELTGAQRAEYNETFDVTVEFNEKGEVKATPGDNFKMMSAVSFLALCFYDTEGKSVNEETIGSYPSTVVESLHTEAMKLSGMDKESLESAKND